MAWEDTCLSGASWESRVVGIMISNLDVGQTRPVPIVALRNGTLLWTSLNFLDSASINQIWSYYKAMGFCNWEITFLSQYIKAKLASIVLKIYVASILSLQFLFTCKAMELFFNNKGSRKMKMIMSPGSCQLPHLASILFSILLVYPEMSTCPSFAEIAA